MTTEERIKRLEERIEELEKTISIISSPDRNVQLKILLENAELLYSFDFTKSRDFTPWVLSGAERCENSDDFTFRSKCEKICTGHTFDPIFQSPDLMLDAQAASLVCLSFEARPVYDKNKNYVKVYFKTSEENFYSEKKSIFGQYNPETDTAVAFVMTQHPLYRGTITGIRIDAFEGAGEIKFNKIRISDDKTTVISQNSKVCLEYDFKIPGVFVKSGFEVLCSEIVSTESGVVYRAIPVEKYRECYDPRLNNDEIVLPIDNVRYIHIRAKCSLSAGSRVNPYAQIYFKTTEHNEYTQSKCVRVHYSRTETMCDLYFDMRQNAFWKGVLTGLRLDMLECSGVVTLELCEILRDRPQHSLGEWVNSVENRLLSQQDESDIECIVDGMLYDRVEEAVQYALDDALEEKITSIVETAVNDAINNAG